MPGARHILARLCAAALRFLAVLVFFALPGLGGSPVLAAAPNTCAASCPCDEAVHGDHEHQADHGNDTESPHDGDAPCEDECPDDCPNCGCGVPSVMALLPPPVVSSPASRVVRYTLVRADAPAKGTHDAIFRPPRVLS